MEPGTITGIISQWMGRCKVSNNF